MSNATLTTVDRALLSERLAERGEPAYRAGQVWRWTAGGATDYGAMTNVPAELRAELDREVPFSTLPGVHTTESRARTTSTPVHTQHRPPVEAVLMRHG